MDTTRLNYRELAKAFGLATPDAARMKAKRQEASGRWKVDRGNHPGAVVYVELPLEDLPAAPPPTTTQPKKPSPPTSTPPIAPDAATLAPIAAELEAQRIRADGLADRLLEEAAAHAGTRTELAVMAERNRQQARELEQADEAGSRLAERLRESQAALAAERRRGWFDKLMNG